MRQELQKSLFMEVSNYHIIIFYLTTLFQISDDVGGKPAASAQFLLNPDSSARATAI
jgi:hypothetical protein